MSWRRLAAPRGGGFVGLYKGVGRQRPAWRKGLRTVAPALALLAWALTGGGCSAIGPQFGGQDDDGLITGSIKPQPVVAATPDGAPPKGIAVSDWAQAKLALQAALADSKNGASMPWENRATGARGTATPLGSAHNDGCRDFRISVVDAAGDRWAQGTACHTTNGIVLSQVRLLERA